MFPFSQLVKTGSIISPFKPQLKVLSSNYLLSSVSSLVISPHSVRPLDLVILKLLEFSLSYTLHTLNVLHNNEMGLYFVKDL